MTLDFTAPNASRRPRLEPSQCGISAMIRLGSPTAIFLAVFATCTFSAGQVARAAEVEEAPGRVEIVESPESTPERTTQASPASRLPEKGATVGRKAAEKYMGPKAAQAKPAADAGSSPLSADHYLAIHVGAFISDDSYRWGGDKIKDPGRFNAGVTYRLGEWVNSADLNIRVDYTTYDFPEGPARKISFLPVVIFPDANSRFPLYFGAGAGAGVFFKQLDAESPISLDYQVFLGGRFFNLFKNTGAFVEAGLKNHVHIFSDGQFNGTYAVVGTVFTF